MTGRLSGKQALITGAGRGIGAAIALRFASEGAALLLNDIDAAAVAAIAEECRKDSAAVHVCVADVSDPSAVERLFDEAVAALGGLTVLVNNAGIGGVGKTILDSDLDEWNRMIAVDLTSVFLACRAAVPLMRDTGRGSIINLSSVTGVTGTAGSVPYASAKAGVIGLSKALAKETAHWRINVNAIAPGLIDTEMSRARGQSSSAADLLWPRIGTPDDIAQLAVYLASDEAEFVTGQVISPNGRAVI
ncbi:3-oxoacyl-[acyl-carrier-protein] reductase [soil metagenome]